MSPRQIPEESNEGLTEGQDTPSQESERASPIITTKQSQTTCQTCRTRHHKCDRVQPVCGPCEESNRPCVPTFNVRFRRRRVDSAADAGLHVNGKLVFDPDQPWVKTPNELSFVSEGPNETENASGPQTNTAIDSPHSPKSTSATRVTPGFDNALPDLFNLIDTPGGPDIRWNDSSPGTPGNPLLMNNVSLAPTSQCDLKNTSSNWLSGIDQNHGSSSLFMDHAEVDPFTRETAQLLHYFKREIGWPWFDITDPEFTTEVLRLAPSYPLLLYAILATAKIHQSRKEVLPDVSLDLAIEAEVFHEKCVGLLLPMIHDKSSFTDSGFFACSTILRFYEEISAPVHGRDSARHLLAGSAAVAEFHEQGLDMEGLTDSAFWVHQRQDVGVALINHRSPSLDPDIALQRLIGKEDGYSWAKRAICLHAEVIKLCFGPGVHPNRDFSSLSDKLAAWDRCKPAAFSPVRCVDPDPDRGQMFPEIYFALDFGALANTYHYFSLLLMTIHDPTLPRIGPTGFEKRRRTNSKGLIRSYLALLCGLAISNNVPPLRTVTGLAISQCGVLISDLELQSALLDVLRMIDREDSWPTVEFQQSLQAEWTAE